MCIILIMENLSPKQLKLAVTHDCALDPSLADKITFIVGFEPRWSQMSVAQLAAVQSAWETLARARGTGSLEEK